MLFYFLIFSHKSFELSHISFLCYDVSLLNPPTQNDCSCYENHPNKIFMMWNNKNMLARYILPSLYSHFSCRRRCCNVSFSPALVMFPSVVLSTFTFRFQIVLSYLCFLHPASNKRRVKISKILSSTQAPVNKGKKHSALLVFQRIRWCAHATSWWNVGKHKRNWKIAWHTSRHQTFMTMSFTNLPCFCLLSKAPFSVFFSFVVDVIVPLIYLSSSFVHSTLISAAGIKCNNYLNMSKFEWGCLVAGLCSYVVTALIINSEIFWGSWPFFLLST